MAAKLPVIPLTVEQQRLVERFREQWNMIALLRVRLPSLYEALATTLDDEDIEQIAYFGVLRAAQLFDPARGCKFVTLALHRIRAALGHEMDFRRRLCRAEPMLLSIDDEAVAAFAREDSRLAEIEDAEEWELVVESLGTLDERERKVIAMRFGFQGKTKTHRDVGKVINRTGATSQTIERAALAKLRRRLAARRR